MQRFAAVAGKVAYGTIAVPRNPCAALAVLLLLGRPGLAQAPPAAAQFPPSQTGLGLVRNVDPALQAAIRENPRSCDSFLPAGVAVKPDAQATFVSYRITTTGEVRDVALYRSSGNTDLDGAAIACVGKYHMLPRTFAGKPTEISSVIGVSWNLDNHTVQVLSPDGSAHACGYEWFPRAALGSGVNASTGVSYRVTSDGSVRDGAVTVSSGRSDLDQAALDCVAGWRFFPVYVHGTAVEHGGQTSILWHAGRPPR